MSVNNFLPAKESNKQILIGSLVVILLLILAPFFIYPVFVMKLMCYALFAATFNLLMGYAGLMSFGHAAFLGAGAYVGAHAAKVWGLEPSLAICAGVVASALLGYLVGFLAIKRKGIEFAMITLALAQMVDFIAHQSSFTGGENGIQEVPRGFFLGWINLDQPVAIYSFTLGLFVLGMFVLWRVVNSPFGHLLQAIRDHEDRATSLGYDVARYKLKVFIVAAAVAGLAGAMKALVFQVATLDDVSFHLSGQVVLIAVLGGIGTFFGPLVGAAIVVTLESALATYEFPVPVLTGIVFICCVLVFRRGVVGEIFTRLKFSR